MSLVMFAVGVAVGAAFAPFWMMLYNKAKEKFSQK